jgi:hypothetical protein
LKEEGRKEGKRGGSDAPLQDIASTKKGALEKIKKAFSKLFHWQYFSLLVLLLFVLGLPGPRLPRRASASSQRHPLFVIANEVKQSRLRPD